MLGEIELAQVCSTTSESETLSIAVAKSDERSEPSIALAMSRSIPYRFRQQKNRFTRFFYCPKVYLHYTKKIIISLMQKIAVN